MAVIGLDFTKYDLARKRVLQQRHLGINAVDGGPDRLDFHVPSGVVILLGAASIQRGIATPGAGN
ncbi:hypothetical protein D3C83_42580 [compost metagenome]